MDYANRVERYVAFEEMVGVPRVEKGNPSAMREQHDVLIADRGSTASAKRICRAELGRA
jgi:hypothetical protein